MSLDVVLKKIKTLQPLANENLDEGPLDTMRARIGRKNQAVESLKRLRSEYSSDLLNTAAFILVIGDKRDEFTLTATENHKCFNTNPDTFYSDLVDRIPASSYAGKESISNIFDILGRHLEDKMLEFDRINGYPQLIFRNEYGRTIRNREDFLSLVKQALTEQIGGEIVGIQAVHSLVDKAIELEHTSKFTPILLPTGDEKFALTVAKDLERISSKVFVIVAGNAEQGNLKDTELDIVTVGEPTSDGVKKALKTISNQLKSNK